MHRWPIVWSSEAKWSLPVTRVKSIDWNGNHFYCVDLDRYKVNLWHWFIVYVSWTYGLCWCMYFKCFVTVFCKRLYRQGKHWCVSAAIWDKYKNFEFGRYSVIVKRGIFNWIWSCDTRFWGILSLFFIM